MKTIYKLLGITIGVFLIILFLTGIVVFIKTVWFDSLDKGQRKIAVFEVNGVLYDASSILKLIDEARSIKSLKAAVVKINSPGGLVGPSQELYSAFKKLDEKIPVITYIQSVGASGGYYVALGGRKIVANPGSITGSIGVIMEFINAEGLYKWAKIEHYSITSGKYKSIGSPFRSMTKEEKELLLNLANDIHLQFKNAISERRNIPPEEVAKIADGRILTGNQAKTYSLIDELGNFDDAVSYVKELAGLDEKAALYYMLPKEGALKKLLLGTETSSFFNKLEKVSTFFEYPSSWRLWLISPGGYF